MDMSKFGFRADFDMSNKVVKQEEFEFEGTTYYVSTVDLGLDHSFGGGKPLWYETMIFPLGEFNDMYCDRYTTREEAQEGHETLLKDIADGKYELIDGYFQRKEDAQ